MYLCCKFYSEIDGTCINPISHFYKILCIRRPCMFEAEYDFDEREGV
jgi:hypothetical protein